MSLKKVQVECPSKRSSRMSLKKVQGECLRKAQGEHPSIMGTTKHILLAVWLQKAKPQVLLLGGISETYCIFAGDYPYQQVVMLVDVGPVPVSYS